MPAAMTHYLLAKSLLPSLSAYGGRETGEKEAFYWGAQGPDFLFCHRILPWMQGTNIRDYGERLHNSLPGEIVECMAAYVCETKSLEALFYVLGFLTHYALDRTAHPYINALSERLKGEMPPRYTLSMLHNQVESELDLLMFKRMEGKGQKEFRLELTVPENKKIQHKIASMYQKLCKEILQEETTNKVLLQATEDCIATFRFLTDTTGYKKKLLRCLEWAARAGNPFTCHMRGHRRKDSVDYANESNSSWAFPEQKERQSNENFYDLYRRAEEDAKNMFSIFLATLRDGIDGKAITGNISFDTGLPI